MANRDNAQEVTQLWCGLSAAKDVTSFLKVSLEAVMAYDDKSISVGYANGLFRILCDLDSDLDALADRADTLGVRMSSSA